MGATETGGVLLRGGLGLLDARAGSCSGIPTLGGVTALAPDTRSGGSGPPLATSSKPAGFSTWPLESGPLRLTKVSTGSGLGLWTYGIEQMNAVLTNKSLRFKKLAICQQSCLPDRQGTWCPLGGEAKPISDGWKVASVARWHSGVRSGLQDRVDPVRF